MGLTALMEGQEGVGLLGMEVKGIREGSVSIATNRTHGSGGRRKERQCLWIRKFLRDQEILRLFFFFSD